MPKGYWQSDLKKKSNIYIYKHSHPNRTGSGQFLPSLCVLVRLGTRLGAKTTPDLEVVLAHTVEARLTTPKSAARALQSGKLMQVSLFPGGSFSLSLEKKNEEKKKDIELFLLAISKT